MIKNLYSRIDDTDKITDYDIVQIYNNTLVVSDGILYGVINLKSKNILNIQCKCIYYNISCFHDGLAIVCKDKKYGLIDEYGKIVVDLVYDFICYKYGYYETEYIGYKGLLDNKGKQLIEPIYKSVSIENSVIIVQKHDSYGLYNLEGKKIFDCNLDYIRVVNDELVILYKDNQAKAFNIKLNKEIISGYQNIDYINDNRLIVQDAKKKIKIIDFNNKVIKTMIKHYDFGFTQTNGNLICFDTKVLIDLDGKKVFKKKNQEVFNYGSIFVAKDDNGYKILDDSGKYLLDYYVDLLYPINDSIVCFIKNHQDGVYIKDNNKLIEPIYDLIKLEGNNLIFRKDNKEYLYDLQGNQLTNEGYHKITYLKEDMFAVKRGRLSGIINNEGQLITDLIYDTIYIFKDGYTQVSSNHTYYLVDKEGHIVHELGERAHKIIVKGNFIIIEHSFHANTYSLLDKEGHVIINREKLNSINILNDNQVIINNCLMNIDNIKYKYGFEYEVNNQVKIKEFDSLEQRNNFIESSEKLIDDEVNNWIDKLNHITFKYNSSVDSNIDDLLEVIQIFDNDKKMEKELFKLKEDRSEQLKRIDNYTSEKIKKLLKVRKGSNGND